MFARNSALVLALYVAAGLIVVLAGHALLSFYDRSPDETPTLPVGDGFGGESRVSVLPRRDSRDVRLTQGLAALAKANQQLRQLQATLEKTSSLLEQRTAELEKTTAECNALRAELDESMVFAFELLAEDEGESELVSLAPDLSQPAAAKVAWKAELKKLQTELGKAELLELEQAGEMRRLRTELMEAELEVATVQRKAEQDTAVFLEAKEALRHAASEAFVRAGASAVPPLINLLADQRAEIREWAASVLGQIGPDAREATSALAELLLDPDASVRAQAGLSLSMIKPEGQK